MHAHTTASGPTKLRVLLQAAGPPYWLVNLQDG